MESRTSARCLPTQYLVVDAQYAGQRVDNFLRTRLQHVPHARIYRGLRRGEVRVNKGRIAPAYRLRAGDVIRIPPLHFPEHQQAVMPNRHLVALLSGATLYEDEQLLVLNKPAGWAVHGGSGERFGIIEAMRIMRPDLRYLELVHRLDRDTSGCLLLAKKRSVLRQLHQGLRDRQLHKRYLLLARGCWRGGMRRVVSTLRKRTLRSGERIVSCDATGKSSVTVFHPLARDAQVSLLQATPITGRTHQIRAQAAQIGYPVAGDAKYGDRDFNRMLDRLGLRRLFLHALAVRWPGYEASGERTVVAPMPTDLREILERLGVLHPLCGERQP